MNLFCDIKHIPKLSHPIAITIGNFDGVHLGHQAIIHKMHTLSSKTNSLFITFSPHPRQFFGNTENFSILTPLPKKLELLEHYGVENLLILPFDQTLANQPYDSFIRHIFSFLPFDFLVLGEDATLGKERKGNKKTLSAFSHMLGFQCIFLNKEKQEETRISSQMIRQLLFEKKIQEAERYLGHPFTFDIFCHNKIAPFTYQIQIPSFFPLSDGLYQATLVLGSSKYAVDLQVLKDKILIEAKDIEINLPFYGVVTSLLATTI